METQVGSETVVVVVEVGVLTMPQTLKVEAVHVPRDMELNEQSVAVLDVLQKYG